MLFMLSKEKRRGMKPNQLKRSISGLNNEISQALVPVLRRSLTFSRKVILISYLFNILLEC